MSQAVFVCGTTGIQGGATARALLTKGVSVHSVTRNASSARTKEITAFGVKFWPGDFDSEEALKSAIAGTSSIFLNFFPDFTDMGANLRQAKLIMLIALRQEPSRWSTQAASALSNPSQWAILRPGVFNSNLIAPGIAQYDEFARTGVLETAWNEDAMYHGAARNHRRLQQLGDPDPAGFHAKEIDYADELATPEDVRKKLVQRLASS
ncbi:hypothetical protein N657DRAFT_674237 [Parathielavia appendiculata]|uniref:NmrA-like domain-containing protein n=1 Tax=Parathielavia appendiculata TaxID=2587402 RepID=A0AAN6TUQ6_9PEZI|nr:hypothetical protein N657DRAFT_674237 [Parathielavia appendiculata]